MKDEVLMVMMVLGLEGLMNNIISDKEDTLGSSIGSFADMTHPKKTVGSFQENIPKERTDAEMVESVCGPRS